MTDRIEALERLAKLKADGVLTEDEFAGQKAVLLGGGGETVAAVVPAGPTTFGERWAQARRDSRGVRHFFRWLLGIQAVAVILIGIYFITRAQTVQQARDAAANEQSATTREAPAPAAPTAERAPSPTASTISITDAILENPWAYDGMSSEASSGDACASSPITIVNRSSHMINLDVGALKSAETVATLGPLPSGSSITFNVPGPRQYVIGNIIQGLSTSLFLLNATDCPQS